MTAKGVFFVAHRKRRLETVPDKGITYFLESYQIIMHVVGLETIVVGLEAIVVGITDLVTVTVTDPVAPLPTQYQNQ